MKRKRGQLPTSDFFLGIMFVIFFVLYFAPFIVSEDRSLGASRELGSVRLKANTVLDTLINSQGTPKNWSRKFFETPGVASKTAGELDEQRLWELNASNYSLVKRGLGAEGIEFNFTVPAAGLYYPSSQDWYAKLPNQTAVYRTKRIAAINGSLVEVILYAW